MLGRAVLAAPPEWVRGFALVTDGKIVLANPERYDIYHPKDVIFAFASIQTQDDAAVFASKYGLLWHGPDSNQLWESWEDWQREIEHAYMIVRYGADLRRAMAGDVKALNDLREVWAPALAPAFEAPANTDSELFEQGSVWLAWALNSKLEGTQEGIAASCQLVSDETGERVGEPGWFLFSPRPPHLLASMYHELALLLVNRRELRVCESCKSVFTVADRRQRFCNKSCASRARYRRWAERRAGE